MQLEADVAKICATLNERTGELILMIIGLIVAMVGSCLSCLEARSATSTITLLSVIEQIVKNENERTSKANGEEKSIDASDATAEPGTEMQEVQVEVKNDK